MWKSIVLALLICGAPLAKAQAEFEPRAVVDVSFEGTDLTREWTVRTPAACSLYVWTESENVDLMQSVQRIGTESGTARPCLAGGAPAFFAESSAAAWEWTIQLQASGPGTAKFLFATVLESEAGDRTNLRARDALAAMQARLGRNERQAAHQGYRLAVREFLDDVEEELTLEQTDVLWELATESRVFRDHGEARACFERLIQSHERLYPPRAITTARARWRLALTYRSLQQLEALTEQLQRLIPVLRIHEPREHEMRRNARCELSVALARLGETQRAEEEIGSYLADYAGELAETHNGVLAVRTALAGIRVERRDLAGARLIYTDVMAALLRSKPALHLNVLRARGNLANAYAQFDESEKALLENRRLLDDLDALADIVDPGRRKSLGVDEAVLLEFSLRVRLNTAVTLQVLNRNEEAIELFEEINRERRRTLPEGHPARTSAALQLANAYARHGEHEASLTLALENLAELEERLPPGHPRLLTCQFTVANSLMGLGREDELVVQARACAAGARASLRAALQYSSRERTAVATALRREIKMLLVVAGNVESPELHRETLELIEHVRVATGTSPRSTHAVEQESEIAKALGEQLRVERSHLGELVTLLNSTERGGEDLDLAAALEACDRAERRYLDALTDAGLWYLASPTAVAIAESLPEGACAVSYWRSGDADIDLRGPGETGNPGAFYAQILRSGGQVSTVRLAGAEVILRASREWRAAIGRPFAGVAPASHPIDADSAGERLRGWILDPLLPLIGDCTRLYVCLDDELHLIPIDALPLNGGVVGERFEIRPLSFLSALSSPRRSTVSGSGMVVAGAVDYGADPRSSASGAHSSEALRRTSETSLFDTHFGDLPNTGVEAREVAASYRRAFGADATLLLGRDATKGALLRLAPGTRYLHLATHGGTALGSSGRSSSGSLEQRQTIESMAPLGLCGIALANANSATGAEGILTGEELSGLDLSACELATLSACDTSVGLHSAGQGLGSLQTALLSAGAQATLTSLWQVDDSWTRVLMREFYAQLWSQDEPSPATALWNAKQFLRRRHAPLRDWAGWVLTGDCEGRK